MKTKKKSLLDEFPSLAAEWHQKLNGLLKPSDVTSGSGKKVWWQCRVNKDHAWLAAIYSRKAGNGCAICAGTQVNSTNSLAALAPEIAKEWDSSKNGNLSPDKVTLSSNRKVWWKCSKHPTHCWDAVIRSRTIGSHGCPYCSGRRADIANNLTVNFPEVAKEWHPTLNGDLKPENFTPKSGKKVWWKCSKNRKHKWEARIGHRTGAGSSCPYCANQLVDNSNSLAAQNPKLAKEWHPTKNGELTPDKITARSGRGVWWVCNRHQEHVWKTSPAMRTSGTGCPECSNNRSAPELRIFAELQDIFPKVISRYKIDGIEIDLFLPELSLGVEYDGSYWHSGKEKKDLNKNMSLAALGIQLIRIREEPLSLLSKNDVSVGYKNFVKTDFNKLLRQILKISNKFEDKIKAHIAIPNFSADAKYRKYLSYLPNPIPENSLEFTHPEVAKLWDYEANKPLTPKNFTAGTAKKVFWVCAKDKRHKYMQRIKSTTELNGSCPICSGKITHWTTSLSTLKPEIAAEWHPSKNGELSPNDVTVKSNKRVWWQCLKNKDHYWKAAVSSRTNGNGCTYCSGRIASAENNLAVIFPEVAKEWHPTLNKDLKPENFTSKSGKKVWWKCLKNPIHSWEAVIASRTTGRHGCPFCSGSRADKDNNLAVKFPEVAREWHPTLNGDLKPENFTPKSGRKIWWKCAKSPQHLFEQAIYRRVDSAKCPFCAGKKVCQDNSLAVLEPDVASSWHPTKNGQLTAADVTIGSGKKVWWQCSINHTHFWESPVSNRIRSQKAKSKGCPFCAGRKDSSRLK